jgi:Zn-finger nucleic acid-binding protein
VKCPACSEPMIVVEHNQIELDYCTNCQGVWFDSEELDLLLESMNLESLNLFHNNIINFPEAKSLEKKRRCPICNQKMKKTTIGQQPEILIDVCQEGHGLWFDSGEVGQLITQLLDKPSDATDSQGRVITFLGEVFRARG